MTSNVFGIIVADGAGVPAGPAGPKLAIPITPGPARRQKELRLPRIAVTPPGYDDIGEVLRRLRLNFEVIPDQELTGEERLREFGLLFLNCSTQCSHYAAAAGRLLCSFVERGGRLYASDWAHGYATAAFPSMVRGERNGSAAALTARLLNPSLCKLLGRQDLALHFDQGSWFRMGLPGPNVEVLAAIGTTPVIVTFRSGCGEVVYTSFHNRAQTGDEIDKLIAFLAIRPLVISTEVAVEVVQSAGGDLQRFYQLKTGGL